MVEIRRKDYMYENVYLYKKTLTNYIAAYYFDFRLILRRTCKEEALLS